jgi:hypothetical protein
MDAELYLPLARVKKIVRSDPEVKIVSHEALYLITKATVCALCIRVLCVIAAVGALH